MIVIKDIFTLIISIIGIILVLYLTYYCTKWLSTKTSFTMKSKYMNIVDKIMLGQYNSIVIVEIYNKYYLMSITEKDINILKELDNFHPLPNEGDSTPGFNNILNKYKKTIHIGNGNDKKI